jgi:hypothetical protein
LDEDLPLRSSALSAPCHLVSRVMTEAALVTQAKRMMRAFIGNNTLHYTADFRNLTIEATGKRVPQYRDIPGPPTLEEFIAHLEGKIGLLVIPVTEAGACRFGAIDIDVYNVDPQKHAAAMARWGLPLVCTKSKSVGAHGWHHPPYTESAHDLRAKLADWSAALHLDPKTEIFPKQERLLPGEKGSGINLPYFGGDTPECRNYAIDKDGKRLTVNEWLAIIERMPAKAAHTPGQVNVEAAADLLSKYWTDGTRDNLNLAVGGALLRAGVEHSLIDDILTGAQGIGVDAAQRADAATIEQMMEKGKKVPGFPKMAELMGLEDAREFMRLAGGKPPVDPLPFSFAAVDTAWLNEVPAPVTYTIQPLLPRGVVGMLVAEGGAGKTSFGMRMAMCVAGGREFFGLPTKQGRTVYVACEEHEDGLRRRLHWIYTRELARMRNDHASPESIELFEQSVLSNLTLTSAVGYELYLVSARNGEAAQSGLIEALIEKLPRPLELLILDPISRLNGGEENSNQVGTALINAAERIAREVGCTLMLCHHTGKAAAKDRDTGLYAARGASGFVDAARSSIRLLQADANDVRNFSNVPMGVVDAGDLIQVIHNKSNEGPKAKPFWLRRQQTDFELFEPVTADGVESHAKNMSALWAWFVQCGSHAFSAKRVTDSAEVREAIWRGQKVSRNQSRDILARATDAGDLIPAPKAAGNQHSLIQFREGYAESNM